MCKYIYVFAYLRKLSSVCMCACESVFTARVFAQAAGFFGVGHDFAILNDTAEKWRAPVLSLFDDYASEKAFPDMDVGVLVKKDPGWQPRLAVGRGKGVHSSGWDTW